MADRHTDHLSRVIVIGTSGSGKSTFASSLAERLNIAHIELDQLFWLPDWVMRDQDEFRALVDENTRGDRWVADGNYSRVRDILWPRATAVIWLDYPFALVLWRSFKRTLYRGATRQEVCNGNRESLIKTFFSRDSIVLWVISTYGRTRERYGTIFDGSDYPDLAKFRLRSPAAAAAFLAGVRKPT